MENRQFVAKVVAVGKNDPPQTVSLKEAQVAFIMTALWPMTRPSTISAIEKAVKILEIHGVKVEEVELLSECRDAQILRRTHKTVHNIAAQAAFLMAYRIDRTKLNPKIRGLC